MNPFHGVCLHHGQFSSCSRLPHIRLLQGLEGFPTGSALPGPGVRDSPTQQHICVTLSPPDGIQNESCSPSRARGLFGLFPRNNVPHLAAGFSPSPTMGRFFLQTASPPDLTFSVLPTERDIIKCQAIQVIRKPSADGKEVNICGLESHLVTFRLCYFR